MKPIHSFIVKAKLPERIEKIRELAYNYWWCWDSDAKELFQRMNRQIWKEVHHNPVALINRMSQQELEDLANQYDFTFFLDEVYEKFKKYINAETWFSKQGLLEKNCIAYLSPEYGINESFPVYSGGLGVLSGDHLKTASDIGLPLVGVGLIYQQGYFRQTLSQNGWQNEQYPVNDFYSMPMTLVHDKNGNPLLIDVDLPLSKVYAQIWQINIGRNYLYLLDTNIDENEVEEYKNITDQLYGGDRDTRIQQEILLGIGGIRALFALGMEPSVIHINEGHAAFALLERTRMYMSQYNIDFNSAMQITRNSSVFTTHTPVPAGNEAFDVSRMGKYFTQYVQELGLKFENLIALGQENGFNYNEAFSMTILGLRLTEYHNGVSKLHGTVSQKMWRGLWKDFPEEEVPIDAITNGVHLSTWIARELTELFDRYLQPSWKADVDNQAIWNNIDTIPSDELWREKQRRRLRLVLFSRDYLKTRQADYLRPDQLEKINEYLDPDTLTIGFARRFAGYKRPFLIFSDMKRLKHILTNKDNPVQIIISGKAHPHDIEGKQMIQSIIQKIHDYGLEKHIVFLEDYDMVISRLMVKGCDIWLNNPIRPMEASGTSGMKAAVNGTINFSILDGWWDEGYNGSNGFPIGRGEQFNPSPEIDQLQADLLYDTMENQIIPLFYERGETRVPGKWVELMKNSIKTITPQFSSHRMVKEYAKMYYLNACKMNKILQENNAKNAVDYYHWQEKVTNEWDKIKISNVQLINDHEAWIGKPIEVSCEIELGSLTPDDVLVQVYYGPIDAYSEEISKANCKDLNLIEKIDNKYKYEGAYSCVVTGKQGFTIRVIPNHKFMSKATDLYLCKWA